MNTRAKKALAGLACGLAIAACSFAVPAAASTGISTPPSVAYTGVNTSRQIAWKDIDKETTNVLSWGTDPTFQTNTQAVTVTTTGTKTPYSYSYTISGLTPGVQYYWQVNDTYNGSYGSGTFAPLPTYTSVNFTGSNTAMPISWQDILPGNDTLIWTTDLNFVNNLQTTPVPAGSDGISRAYTMTGLTSNLTYYYEVKDPNGNVCANGYFVAGSTVLKSPYMIYPVTSSQPGATTSMEVLWQDNDTYTDTISWYSDAGFTQQVGTAQSSEYNVSTLNNNQYGHQHEYAITGLQANTKYYYQVVDAYNVTYSGSFITAPDTAATHVKFLAQGDSRSVPYQLDALMQLMTQFYQYTPDGGQTYPNADYQRLSIANGDWVSTDGDKYWNAEWFQPTQKNVRAYTANVPINGIKGNHDDSSGWSATFPKYYPFPYPTAQGAMSARTGASASDSDGNPYYNNLYWSFDYGPVHFIMVDEYSNMAQGSPQYTFIQNDLASTTKPWKIMLYHEASYSAGADGDNSAVLVLEPLLTQYNVDLVYSGHSHNYARCGAYNLKQAGGDNIALNVPHITSGGGGAPVYPVDLSNAHGWPHVITAWPATEFMAFDVEGNTLTMVTYEVAGLNVSNSGSGNTYVQSSSGSIVAPPAGYPPANLSINPIETVVLNHFPNVTSQITAKVSNFAYNRGTKMYTGTVTLTNNGPALSGDLHLVLDGILNLGTPTVPGVGTPDTDYFIEATTQGTEVPGPPTSIIANNPGAYSGAPAGVGLISNVTAVNQTGSNNGEPMIKAPLNGQGLATGASVTIPLQLSNTTNSPITFNPIILNELPGE